MSRGFICFLFFSFIFPALMYSADLENGKQIFHKYCTECHGLSGAGDGPSAMALDPRPRDLNDLDYMQNLSNQELFNVIQKGGHSSGMSEQMPAWGSKINDDEMKDLIFYVRSLSEKS